MNYKYHHTILKWFYLNLPVSETNKETPTNDSKELETRYSTKKILEGLKIENQEKTRSILTSLREEGCLNSRYDSSQKEVLFWITDIGISKYHEQYFRYKRKEQVKTNWSVSLKLLFYFISTIGIITSIIYNISRTQSILQRVDKLDSTINLNDSTKYFQNDSINK